MYGEIRNQTNIILRSQLTFDLLFENSFSGIKIIWGKMNSG